MYGYTTARPFGVLLACSPQGTAADIVKTAMVLVARRLDAWRSSLEEGLDCPRLIMQVPRPHVLAVEEERRFLQHG